MRFSRFAHQLDPGSGILQLMRDLGGSDDSPEPVAMLGGGNPAAIPEMESVFRAEMDNLLSEARTFEAMVGTYDAPRGNQAFLQALAELLSEDLSQPLGPENIAITNGSQSAFGVLFNLFGGPADDGSCRQIALPLAPEYIGYGDFGPGEPPLRRSTASAMAAKASADRHVIA